MSRTLTIKINLAGFFNQRLALLSTTIVLSLVALGSYTRAVYGYDLTELTELKRASIVTKGHPNAAGLSLSMTYPLTWRSRQQLPAPLVAELVSDEGEGREACNLSIVPVASPDEDIEIKDDFVAQSSNSDFSRFVPQGYQLLAGDSVAIDDSPAMQLLLSEELTVDPMPHRFYALSYVYVDGRYIIVNCGTLANDRQQALFQFKESLPVFASIANSVKIHNKRVTGSSANNPQIRSPGLAAR